MLLARQTCQRALGLCRSVYVSWHSTFSTKTEPKKRGRPPKAPEMKTEAPKARGRPKKPGTSKTEPESTQTSSPASGAASPAPVSTSTDDFKWLRLVKKDGWEYCERAASKGVAVMIPVTSNLELILIEQFRPALGAAVLEIPAGLVGDLDVNEEEEAAAKRELLEETGFESPSWRKLFTGPSSPGMSNELLTFWLAQDCVKKQEPVYDPSERITAVHVVPIQDVPKFISQKQLHYVRESALKMKEEREAFEKQGGHARDFVPTTQISTERFLIDPKVWIALHFALRIRYEARKLQTSAQRQNVAEVLGAAKAQALKNRSARDAAAAAAAATPEATPAAVVSVGEDAFR